MEEEKREVVQSKQKKSATYYAILLAITSTILFIDSIFIIISSFRKGVYRKQILSKKSNFGFNFDIIIKS